MSAIRQPDATSAIEAAAQARRLQPVDAARIVGRPAEVVSTYAELEHDDLAAEQDSLFRAEGIAAGRAAESTAQVARPGYRTARAHLKGQRAVVRQARDTYLQSLTHLGPYRHREPGAKLWYLIRWGFLLGGDIAGQAGAALSLGEPYVTAIPQALASGMAALTAGMVGGELRTLRDAARRQCDPDSLPEALARWAHLFRSPDRGRAWALLIIGIGASAGLTVAGGIFWLRMLIEGAAAGAVYGLLAVGIALASAINSYFYADEIAGFLYGILAALAALTLLGFALVFIGWFWATKVLSIYWWWAGWLLTAITWKFGIDVAQILAEHMRALYPENLHHAFDLIAPVGIPATEWLVKVGTTIAAAVPWVVELRMLRGFRRDGDAYRGSDYYQRWCLSPREEFPTLWQGLKEGWLDYVSGNTPSPGDEMSWRDVFKELRRDVFH